MISQYRTTTVLPTLRPENTSPLANCVSDTDALNQIFSVIGTEVPIYADIGVGRDSVNCPTHQNLFDLGWRGLLIEHTGSVFQAYKEAFNDRDYISVIHRQLEFSHGSHEIDEILETEFGTKPIDLLGLRLSGPEYQAWESLTCQPRVIAIRFNPTIPANIEYVQEDGPGVRKGCSLLALVILGRSLGYQLAYVGELAIFVRNEDFIKLGIKDNDISALWRCDDWLTPIMIGLNGRIITKGGPMLWNRIGRGKSHFCENDVQPLPESFQTLFP